MFRHIPETVPSIDDLGLPPIVKRLCTLEQGLVLVTGITGSGKTTTLAAMVEEINSRRSGVIISVEDPIEYIFNHNLCRVKQREIGTDTKSFPEALKHVLRQDPDVILISEMRDLETISRGDHSGGNGASRLGDAAHDRCSQGDRPHRRCIPARSAKPDHRAVGECVAGDHRAAAVAEGGRHGARGLARK